MSLSGRLFASLVVLAGLVATALLVAAIRLLQPLTPEADSPTASIGRWCLLVLTGSVATDELLLLGVLALLPTALLAGLGSLAHQV